jgi:hypothetical protein
LKSERKHCSGDDGNDTHSEGLLNSAFSVANLFAGFSS